MSSRRRPMLALVATFALTATLVAGCGSSGGSDVGADETTTTSTSVTTTTSGTTEDDGSDTTDSDSPTATSPMEIDPSLSMDAAAAKALESIDTSDFCTGVEGFADLFQSLFTGFGSTAERPEATKAEEAAFDDAVEAWAARMRTVVPAEIADDFEVFAEDPTGLGADQTPEQQESSDRVGDYVQEHCNIPTGN